MRLLSGFLMGDDAEKTGRLAQYVASEAEHLREDVRGLDDRVSHIGRQVQELDEAADARAADASDFSDDLAALRTELAVVKDAADNAAYNGALLAFAVQSMFRTPLPVAPNVPGLISFNGTERVSGPSAVQPETINDAKVDRDKE